MLTNHAIYGSSFFALSEFVELLAFDVMDNVAFDALVGELEKKYEKDYQGLVWSTFWLMVLGYVVMFLSLLLLLAIIGFLCLMLLKAPNAVTIKIGLAVGVVVVPVFFHLLSSLWVRTDAPEGIVLRKKDSPELFAELDQIAAQSSTIHFSKILINGEFNACVVNTPLLGIFGWSRHHLVIGLPLMDAMPRDEFVSILAHEYAHFSHSHGKLGNWIYRARSTWVKTSQCIFERDSVFVKPLQFFLGWFWPRLNAKSFVVSRMNEYQADRFAAAMTSADIASRALARVHVQALRSDREFWSKLTERAVLESTAPSDIIGDLRRWVSGPNPNEKALLRESFLSVTDTADTHPCLRDRVASIKRVSANDVLLPDHLPAFKVPASEELFSLEKVASLRTQLSQKWTEEVREAWKSRHQEINAALKGIEGLDDSKSSQWKRIEIRSEVFGLDSVASELEAFTASYPEHKSARFLYARHLLDLLDCLPKLRAVKGSIRADRLDVVGSSQE